MSKYEEMIRDIRKAYPLCSPDRIHIENPLDCAFMIIQDEFGNETFESTLSNLDKVTAYRARRQVDYDFRKHGI